MEFKQFKELMQAHVASMLKGKNVLFLSDVDKDKLWETYLESFPPGTNQVFRERREHDCSCCRHFVKSFGNVVGIGEDDKIETIWDFRADSQKYGPVIQALSDLVKSAPIKDVFVTDETAHGTDCNHERREDGTVITWDHFHVRLPKQFVTKSSKTIGSITGEYRDIRNVFKRSLEEIDRDAIDSVLDLISQKSLYKGEEWKGVLDTFLALHDEYHRLASVCHDNWLWSKSIEVGAVIGKIRNHSIGVLLTDISGGMDLDAAVRRYEAIVAPHNYKRPKAIFTKKMVEQAEKKLDELGLLGSLRRRFATIDDITVNNILFANRDSLKKIGGVFEELKGEVAVNPKQFTKVEEVPVEQFLDSILPRLTGIEVFLENRHVPNMVSVIAPQNKDAKTLFKWNNGFSWAYNGNITDSMKERVKAAGGKVDGVLRFSLQWNEDGDNQNDFDAHCVEPSGSHIYYAQRHGTSNGTTGALDVDIIHPDRNQVAVENITWTNKNRMQEGVYTFFVNNFSHRGGRSGFRAEIEFDGQIHEFDYQQDIPHTHNVYVAKVSYSRENGFAIQHQLPSSLSSRKVWGIDTNQFQPVSVVMFSPNYWDRQPGIGHRHHFFILKGCINDTSPNGFFNEFLREDLMAHKRVFEALGSKMRVAPSQEQLSGLGFSSTKHNSLICKLEGHVTRTIKIIF